MCNHAPIEEPLGTFSGWFSCPRILRHVNCRSREFNYQLPKWWTTAQPHTLQKNDLITCWLTFAIHEPTLPVCTDITEAAGLKFNLGRRKPRKVRKCNINIAHKPTITMLRWLASAKKYILFHMFGVPCSLNIYSIFLLTRMMTQYSLAWTHKIEG